MLDSNPVEVFLTEDQKSLLKQFADENWTGIVATGSDESKTYSDAPEAKGLGDVLHETAADPDGLAKVDFGGIVASAAVW